MDRYKGRRFFAFMATSLLVFGAFYMNHPETFQAFANVMAGLFGVYVAGQSATDYKKISNGGS